MITRVSFFCLYLILKFTALPAQSVNPVGVAHKPKLIIGLVIDQMRWDYLYRFNDLYGTEGFKRLLMEGFSCENTMIPYVPTYTAPGHSCIYTGSVPAIHGIVGNNWFERSINKNVYCADDSTAEGVGSSTVWGKMSPQNLWTTTITDELRFSNNFKSKVISIALKDRASIFPGGHSANAAYWYDEQAGKWITSSYYMKQLPGWLQNFNNKHYPDSAMTQDWQPLLPIEKYKQSTLDGNVYEQSIPGEVSKTFPHYFSRITTGKYEAFKYSPAAITYTFNLARAAIENEKIGTGPYTDFVALSISSTDYIGHKFGPNSPEVEDIYLRLDREIAQFLKYLDKTTGRGNYLLFLTADHGIAHIPGFLKGHKTPSGTYNDRALMDKINLLLDKQYNVKHGIKIIENYQVYIDQGLRQSQYSLSDIKKSIIEFLHKEPYVLQAFESDQAAVSALPEALKKIMLNSYNPNRSGDIQFTLKPAWFVGGNEGTTHGSWNPYDSHIPLVWFGSGIRPGKSHRHILMTDIAPTIAAILQIQEPNGCVGKAIEEIIPGK